MTLDAAAVATFAPFGDDGEERVKVGGAVRGAWARTGSASSGYLALAGLPLLAGRDLSSADRRGAPGVAVVNQKLARDLFAGRDPIGRRLQLGEDSTPRFVEIVGIVGERGIACRRRDPAPHVPGD